MKVLIQQKYLKVVVRRYSGVRRVFASLWLAVPVRDSLIGFRGWPPGGPLKTGTRMNLDHTTSGETLPSNRCDLVFVDYYY